MNRLHDGINTIDFKREARTSLPRKEARSSLVLEYLPPTMSVLAGGAAACVSGGPGWGLLTLGVMAAAFKSSTKLSSKALVACQRLAVLGFAGFAACVFVTGNPVDESKENAVKTVLSGSTMADIKMEKSNWMSSWGETRFARTNAKIIDRKGDTVNLLVNSDKGQTIETYQLAPDALGRPQFKKIESVRLASGAHP